MRGFVVPAQRCSSYTVQVVNYAPPGSVRGRRGVPDRPTTPGLQGDPGATARVGLLQTSVGLFSLPAPYIGGQLWERLTPQTPFALTGLGLLAAAVPAWLKFKPKEGKTLAEEGVRPA
jgi:hypothetical protein